MDTLEALSNENTKLKQELIQVKRESRQYLQNVAHQLTAPLGAIKWSIEGLKTDKPVPLEKRKRLLSSVYSQATILVHLIKNFTLMSNLEADHELGQFREQPEAVDMLRLCINMTNDFQPQAEDYGKDIKIDHESFDEIYRRKSIKIIKNLIAQAISNILENAVKYADDDSVISIRAVNRDTFIGISIESQGIPINDSEASLLFDRNFRGEIARQKVPAGTGIGLYLVNRIMKIHGGKIELDYGNKITKFSLLFSKANLI